MKQLSLTLITLFPLLVEAGTGSGKIVQIYAHEKLDGAGVVFFETENNFNKAACSIVVNQWAVRMDTDQGKAMYSLLLSAAATGKSITVDGKGDCADWGDRERPKYIRVVY